ncbi:DUF11 domain-containing protein [Streptomyces hebeiensis]
MRAPAATEADCAGHHGRTRPRRSISRSHVNRAIDDSLSVRPSAGAAAGTFGHERGGRRSERRVCGWWDGPTLTWPTAPHVVFTKTAVPAGPLEVGDVITYRITARNEGGGGAGNLTLTDAVPAGTTYLPGSLRIVAGPNAGAKSDAKGDDQANYDADTNTVVFRLGSDATDTQGAACPTPPPPRATRRTPAPPTTRTPSASASNRHPPAATLVPPGSSPGPASTRPAGDNPRPSPRPPRRCRAHARS